MEGVGEQIRKCHVRSVEISQTYIQKVICFVCNPVGRFLLGSFSEFS